MENVRVVKEEIPAGYGRYLRQMQEKNRKLKEMKSSDKQNDREQGFRLYYSGANKKFSNSAAAPVTGRRTKTSREVRNHSVNLNQPQRLPKTAPLQRKGWSKGDQDIHIKTTTGDVVKIDAPFKYEEDFEEDDNTSESVVLNLDEVNCLRQSLRAGDLDMSIVDDIEEDIDCDSSSDSTVIDDDDSQDPLHQDLDSVRTVRSVQQNDDKLVLQLRKSMSPLGDEKDKLNQLIARVMELSLSQRNNLLTALDSCVSDKKDSIEKTSVEDKKDVKSNDFLVKIVLSSNWGHPGLIGLTEVQFYGQQSRQIVVDKVCFESGKSSVMLERVINNRHCTVQERDMFRIQNTSHIAVVFALSQRPVSLKIWNYNRDNLTIGVRRIKVYLNDQLSFEGDVDQGCGRTDFDYGHVIPLLTSPKHRVKIASDASVEEDISSAAGLYKIQKKIAKTPRFNQNNQHLTDSNPVFTKPRCPTRGLGQPSDKIQRPIVPEYDEEDDDDLCMMDRVKQLRRSGGKRSIDDKDVITSKNDTINDEPQQFGLNTMGFPKVADISVKPAKFGRRSDAMDVSESLMNDIDLEKSYASINLFNKQTAGRIQTDVQDDVLDCLLNKNSGRSVDIDDDDNDDVIVEDDDGFVIPELPTGCCLRLDILSTWGDNHYLGLTGLEIFDCHGQSPEVDSISADPADINVLPEYSDDPRVVTNLLDGIYNTSDDLHMWLCPFTSGKRHSIIIQLHKPCVLALLRIWNYSKSRVHSSRGAKLIEIFLDNVLVFRGEISRDTNETILFTDNDDILEKIGENDYSLMELEASNEDDLCSTVRPRTQDSAKPEIIPAVNIDEQQRPFTSVQTNNNPSSQCHNKYVIEAKKITFHFTATWNDMHYLGLTGIQFTDARDSVISLEPKMLSASPRDMRSLDGCEMDERVLENLINDSNLTNYDCNMWLIPFTPGKVHTVEISFDRTTQLHSIRFWNYNKSVEDTYRGAKIVHIEVDGQYVTPPEGLLLRKAPGHVLFDFAQEVIFSELINDPLSFCLTKSNNLLPCGFIYQLSLLNTHGDHYYIGLTGIQLYDENNQLISLSEKNIAAYPDSINIIDGVDCDIRTPDKLIDKVCPDMEGRHSWLSPILPGITNTVFIIFDRPVCIRRICLWNYCKTLQRGVRDFSLLVDELVIFNGSLPSSDKVQCATVLFDESDVHSLPHSQNYVISNMDDLEEQDILLMNDQIVISDYQKKQRPPDFSLRPQTSIIRR